MGSHGSIMPPCDQSIDISPAAASMLDIRGTKKQDIMETR